MSRLIVPAHAKGLTEAEKQQAEARNVLICGAAIMLPGSREVIQVGFEPVHLEMAAMAITAVAFQEIRKKAAEEVANRILPNSNGHVN